MRARQRLSLHEWVMIAAAKMTNRAAAWRVNSRNANAPSITQTNPFGRTTAALCTSWRRTRISEGRHASAVPRQRKQNRYSPNRKACFARENAPDGGSIELRHIRDASANKKGE